MKKIVNRIFYAFFAVVFFVLSSIEMIEMKVCADESFDFQNYCYTAGTGSLDGVDYFKNSYFPHQNKEKSS